MKVLEPRVSIILTSHNKPLLREALLSIMDQTRKDIQIIVIDSGVWIGKYDDVSKRMKRIYDDYVNHPLIDWYTTGEPTNARDLYCPVSHFENIAIKQNLCSGKYICTFYDDDIYYPTFIEVMAGYLDNHQEAMIVRCSENRKQIISNGTHEITPPLEANREILGGENMDCVVDGMQVMMRKELFTNLEYPYFPEDPDWNSCSHSDGIFFNKISKVIDKMHAIPMALCEHRATQYSTFTPTV